MIITENSAGKIVQERVFTMTWECPSCSHFASLTFKRLLRHMMLDSISLAELKAVQESTRTFTRTKAMCTENTMK